MDELTPYLEQLKALGPRMDSLRRSPFATLCYHALADAVYWSDELPGQIHPDAEDALRCILRYRTQLILGEKLDPQLRLFWEIGLRAFPQWIGFSSARVLPTQSVIRFYQRAAAKFNRELDALCQNDEAE